MKCCPGRRRPSTIANTHAARSDPAGSRHARPRHDGPSFAEPEPSLLVEPAWFEATHTDFDLYEQGCEGDIGECTALYEQAIDPTLYIDVSKIADANRDIYFETFFMAGVLSSQSYTQMSTLSAALEQSEEIMQWINASSCVVQRVLQFGVCWGLREVLLSRRSCPSFDFHTGH
mgnify:CR=1 FL=1